MNMCKSVYLLYLFTITWYNTLFINVESIIYEVLKHIIDDLINPELNKHELFTKTSHFLITLNLLHGSFYFLLSAWGGNEGKQQGWQSSWGLTLCF